MTIQCNNERSLRAKVQNTVHMFYLKCYTFIVTQSLPLTVNTPELVSVDTTLVALHV